MESDDHQLEVESGTETIGFDGEPTRNCCLRCFDSKVYQNSKYEKCRCCNGCPRLQYFFSNRYTRVFLLLVSLFFFVWFIYCMWAIAELLKMKNSQLELTSFVVPNLCNPLVPFLLAANISNPTPFEFTLHSLSVSVSYGDGPSFASTKFTPQFGSSNVFKGGMNNMSISTSISVDHAEELAKLISALVSQTPNVKVVAESTLDVTTDAFWFPIRTTLSVPYELILNDQTPPDEEELEKQKLKPVPPPPALFEMELADWNSLPKPMNASDGLYVKSHLTLSPWDMAVEITVPDLYLQFLVNNSYAGELHVNEFLFAWLSPAQVTAAIGFWDPDTAVMKGLQELVGNLTNNENVTVTITGSTASPLNNASATGSTCLAQSVLNVMPRTSVTFSLNKTEDDSSSLQGHQQKHYLQRTKKDQGRKNAFKLFAEDEEEESSVSVTLSRITSQSLKRMECPNGTQRVTPYNRGFSDNCTLTLTVGVDFLFNMTNVTVWGKFPTVFMEIASKGDSIAWVGITPPYRSRADAINGATISMPVVLRVETDQEQNLYSRLVLDGESVADMELTLRGRKGENGLSEVLAGMNFDMSTSEDDDGTGGGDTGGDDSDPIILRDSSLRINSTDTTLELDLNLLLNNAMLDTGFEVVIPSFLDVAISHNQTTSLLRFSQYGSFMVGVTANYSLLVRLDAQEGSNLGVMVNDFFDSKLTTFVVKNTANGAPDTAELDIFFDFTKDDLTTSTTSSSSPTRRRILSTNMGNRRLLQDTDDLIDNLGSITLGKWYRETSGYDFIQLVVAPTVDLPIIAYGNIPAVNLELWTRPTDGSVPLLILSVDTTPFAVTYENEGIRGGNFSIAVDLSTESELDLYNTLLGDINLRIQGRNTTDPSVISAFLTSLNATIEANRSSESAPDDEDEDEDDGIDWSLLSIFADANETDLFVNASTTLPAGIIPVSIYLGIANLQFSSTKPDFLHILTLDSGSIPLQYENCDECTSDVYLRATGTHPDGGRNLSEFLKGFLANEAPTLQLLGSFGNASVNVSFKAFKEFPEDIMQKLTHDLTENALPNASNPVANPTSGNSGISLNSFQILDDGAGGPVTIPCVFPSILCSSDKSLTTTNISMAVNVTIPNPLPMPLSLRLPAISLDVDCCIHTRILRVTTVPFTYMGQGNKPGAVEFDNVAYMTVLIQPANLTLLYQAMHEIVTLDDLPSQIRIHGTPSPANLFSSALSVYESIVTFDPNASANSSSSNSTSTSTEFRYWLSETTDNSVTVTLQTNMDFPLSFPIEFGLVNFTLSYLGVDFASTGVMLNLYPGNNQLLLDFKLFGMPTLDAPCTNVTMVNPRFCVANEFLSRMIGKDSYPEGTPAHVTAMFYNIHGTPVALHLDLDLFGKELSDRAPSSSSSSDSDSDSDSSPGLIDGAGAEVTDTAWSFLTSATESSFDIHAWLRIRNIFNVSVLVTRIEVDVAMKDWDGSHDYSQYPVGPYPIDLAYPISSLDNALSLTLTPDEVSQADLLIPLQWSSITELAGRAYDDFAEKKRFCMHMRNGKLTLTLQGKPTDTPLTYTQTFTLDDITAAGEDACVTPTTCWAQTKPVWDYPQFDAPLRSGWKLNGDATWGSGDTLELTNDDSQLSSAWQMNPTYLLNRWQITFDFQTLSGGAGQADGVAFVIHNDGRGLNTTGTSCSSGFCHGYKGIQKSVGVIFDSYSLNEAATFVNGTQVAFTYANTEFDDENVHTFRMAYHPKKKKLEAWLDGTIMMMPTIDLNTLGLEQGKGYIGWTSSTGFLSYSTQSIAKSTFGGYLTLANNSFLIEKALVRGMVGTQGWFTIDARDSCGEPRLEGGDSWSITMTSVEDAGKVATPDRVEDHGDGTYRVFFTIPMGYPEGEYVVDGAVDGAAAERLGSVLVAPAK